MEEFKNDFRCITMDQRNANGGESTGPIPVDDPWGAFADDQLGLMDHLGIREFFFMGYCIGGPFALKLIGAGPERVVAAVLLSAGRAPAGEPGRHVQFRPGHLGARAARSAARPDHGAGREIPAQPLPRPTRLCVQRVARLCAFLPDADTGHAGRHRRRTRTRPPWISHRWRRTPR